MAKYQTVIDAVLMLSISIFMIIQIDKYINKEEHLRSTTNIFKLEHQRDSVIDLYFNHTLDTASNITSVRVNIHNEIIRKNVNFEFSTYPIFKILSDKSIDGQLLLSLHESIFIEKLIYSNYVDTICLLKENTKDKSKNFITHFRAQSEAIIFYMYYPSVQSEYSVMPTIFENMFKTLSYSDSAFIEFKGEQGNRHYTLDSNHMQFINAIHQICNLSKQLELELLNNDSIFQLQNGRYLEY